MEGVMASITLKDGDFGAGIEIVVNEAEFILPDPARGGLRMAVPHADIVEMEAIADDRSGQAREAVRLGLQGLRAAGPVGLAASLLAVSKPKAIVFKVRIKDGRGFTATAEGATYATLRGYYAAARNPAADKSPTAEDQAADAIVKRYMAEKPQSGGRAVQPSPVERRSVSGASLPAEGAPVFGRRRTDR
jgi:hypothetical protein